MSRLDYEIRKIKKQKSKYELPRDIEWWSKEAQDKILQTYKEVILKDTVIKNRMVFGGLIVLWLPWSFIHWSITLFGALLWAFWGLTSERQLIDRFEKI